MITYKYYKETSTILVKLEEEVSVEELIQFFDTAMKSISLPKKFNILMDNRFSTSIFSIEEVKLIRDVVEKIVPSFDEIRQALLIKSVQGTTSALFYKHISNSPTFHFNVFTTYNAAVTWLNIDLSNNTFIKNNL